MDLFPDLPRAAVPPPQLDEQHSPRRCSRRGSVEAQRPPPPSLLLPLPVALPYSAFSPSSPARRALSRTAAGGTPEQPRGRERAPHIPPLREGRGVSD